MTARELLKRTVLVRTALGSNNRHYVYKPSVDEGYIKKFNYVQHDIKVLQFANDEMGLISDCFILYALAHLGIADKESISLFIRALSKKNPDLSLAAHDNMEAMDTRIRAMMKCGLLFNIRYEALVEYPDRGVATDIVSLFTLNDDAYNIMKQKTQRRISVNSWIAAKSMNELIGWAAAGYIGVHIAQNDAFVDYLDRVLRTKMLGSVYLPCELLTCIGDDRFYVAIISAYLFRDKRMQTKRDYQDICAFKLNTIKNYLSVRTTKGMAILVIAVSDNTDLMEITQMIVRNQFLNDYLSYIYFTGEGAFRSSGNIRNCFLQVILDSKSDKGYEIVSADPIFMV